jgi:hypothetical protein
MSEEMELPTGVGAGGLSNLSGPTVRATINYCERVPRAWYNITDPSASFRPLHEHWVTIEDARPNRDRLDLDREGFILLDHVSQAIDLKVSTTGQASVRDEDLYHRELITLIRELSGADLVLPYRTYLMGRRSQRTAGENGDGLTRPADFVHADVTRKSFHDWLRWVPEEEGLEPPPHWRRAALYQAWRVLSDAPQDYPLTLTDGRTVKPDDYVPLDTLNGLLPNERMVESRLGVYDPSHRWFYFSNMSPREVILFKGYDTAHEEQTVLHTAFSDLERHSHATPRKSIEARFIAFWRD